MKTQLEALNAYLKSKALSIAILVAGFVAYRCLPDNTPFLELFYTALTILSTVVSAPFIRLIVFNEAASYAENGGLMQDLNAAKFTPALLHYWFATLICYATSLACMASITK